MIKAIFVLMTGGLLLSASAGTHRLVAASGNKRVQLLELYSSESCSSCPPADKWIATLKDDAELWKKVVPLVFHVDYWNDLGWKDGLSSNSMTKRQQDIAQTWATPAVYTPAFVINGREWRGWSSGSLPTNSSSAEFSLEIFEDQYGDFSVTVKSLGVKSSPKPLVVRIAKLGMSLNQQVTSGENSGKILNHNFAVLKWDAQTLSSGSGTVVFHLGKETGQNKTAIAAWIETPGKPVPLQAAGGYL